MFQQKNQTPIDKNSRLALMRKYESARMDLLITVIMTLVNFIFLFLDSSSYFLFSIASAYYLPGIAMAFDEVLETGTTLTIIASVIGALIIAGYAVCWWLSKKKSGFMLTATILFGVDTAFLLFLAFIFFADPLAFLLDIVFHVILLVIQISGTLAGMKAFKMPEEEAAIADADVSFEISEDEKPVAQNTEENVWDNLQPNEENNNDNTDN